MRVAVHRLPMNDGHRVPAASIDAAADDHCCSHVFIRLLAMGASQSTQQPPAYADLEGVYGAGDSDTSQQADANGEPELDELHNVNR